MNIAMLSFLCLHVVTEKVWESDSTDASEVEEPPAKSNKDTSQAKKETVSQCSGGMLKEKINSYINLHLGKLDFKPLVSGLVKFNNPGT